MSKRVFDFELDGKTVLGFDSGLDARTFAQTKMAKFINQPGYIVFPDGKIEIWQSEGVAELAKSMIIWGLHFPGEQLLEIIDRQSEALDALRYWLKARIALEKYTGAGKEFSFPGPAGAYIVTVRQIDGQAPSRQTRAENYPLGTIFFPPGRLLKRALDAAGALLEAQRWIHPDFTGKDEISFCAGVMLYHIFCDTPPFHLREENELREDIREGVFVPPRLAAPGLDPEMSELITGAISPITNSKEAKPRPLPDSILAFIGRPASRPASSWVKTLNGKEISSARLEYDQYTKRAAGVVKTRRFLIRNTAAIAAILVVFLISLFFTRSIIRSRAELPSTIGMTAIEVVKAYYSAFSALDHAMMQACVTGRAGRNDIQTVSSLFVVIRVRQAHEGGEFFMSAEQWLDAGQPETDKIVFGITDIEINVLWENSSNAVFEAAYRFWSPAANENEENPAAIPQAAYTRDIVSLAFQRGAWRITGIERTIQN